VLQNLIVTLAKRTFELLAQSRPFAAGVHDTRLALEISVIQTLAENLCRRLMMRDPLCERVHHGKSEILLLAVPAAVRFAAGRLRRRNHPVVIADERR
jgi:hypothetical protein